MTKLKLTLLLLLFIVYSCKRDDEAYSIGNKKSVPVSAIIKISSVSAVSLAADTMASSIISFHIHPESEAANRAIALSTTLGNFSNGKNAITITADAAGNAQASIKSSLIGDATITATVKTVSVDTLIHFTAAQPDDMLLSADGYNIDTSAGINVTATLSRSPGKGIPTDPAKVWFTVTPAAGAEVLICPAFASTSAHAVTVNITNPFKLTGTFTIEAKTAGDNATTITKTVTVVIK